MAKISVTEGVKILLPGALIEIDESVDGTYNIKINDYTGESVRVGIVSKGCIEYKYWKEINKRESGIADRQ